MPQCFYAPPWHSGGVPPQLQPVARYGPPGDGFRQNWSGDWSSVRSIFAVYCASGALSLCYQVFWFRIFVNHFGSATLTFALVVMAFIAGLALGAHVSQAVCAYLCRRLRIDNPLRLYGLIEIAIGIASLLTLVVPDAAAAIQLTEPYILGEDGIYRAQAAVTWTQLILASVCVFFPCAMMGLTYPLLCCAAPQKRTFPSTLYASNTLGACLGIMLCEFVLLRYVGCDRAFVVAAAVNVIMGTIVAVFAKRMLNMVDLHSDPTTRAARTKVPPGERTNSRSPLSTATALFVGVLSGGACGMIEGDAFKRLWFLECDSHAAMSFISLWAIAATYIAATIVSFVPRMPRRLPGIAMIASVGCMIMTWLVAYPVRDSMMRWVIDDTAQRIESGVNPPAGGISFSILNLHPAVMLLYVGLLVFPGYLLCSFALPWMCNQLHAQGRSVGPVYAINTAGFCMAMAGASWIAPQVSSSFAFKVAIGLLAVFAVAAFIVLSCNRFRWWQAAIAALGGAGVIVLTPWQFDPDLLHPSSAARSSPILASRSNAAHTIFVVETTQDRRLYFDSHSMSGTSTSIQRYMRLMAHVPLLAQESPRAALVICYGVGNTASAIARHESIQSIDIVDLNDAVFKLSPWFAATNHDVIDDHRVRLFHDDGRNYLRLTSQRYDLITSEPPPPMQEGISRLYSREYYDAVLDRLTPGGMMTQWLPTWQLSQEAVGRIIATFVASFPETLLFVGSGEEYILLGSRIAIDPALIVRRFHDSQHVRSDLASTGITDPFQILLRFVQTDSVLRRFAQPYPLISDDLNALAFLPSDPLHPPVIRREDQIANMFTTSNQEMKHEITRIWLQLADDERAIVRLVPDFPISTLMASRLEYDSDQQDGRLSRGE